jgi:E3 ubiquitin-protein ligase SIAH1
VCKECREKLQTCPVCKIKLKHNRNLTAEKMLEMIPVKCSFKDDGCNEELLFGEREKHRNECQFRHVKCPDQDCNLTISIQKLLEHIEVHNVVEGTSTGLLETSLKVKESEFAELTKSVWILQHFQYQGKHFFLQVSRDWFKKNW